MKRRDPDHKEYYSFFSPSAMINATWESNAHRVPAGRAEHFIAVALKYRVSLKSQQESSLGMGKTGRSIIRSSAIEGAYGTFNNPEAHLQVSEEVRLKTCIDTLPSGGLSGAQGNQIGFDNFDEYMQNTMTPSLEPKYVETFGEELEAVSDEVTSRDVNFPSFRSSSHSTLRLSNPGRTNIVFPRTKQEYSMPERKIDRLRRYIGIQKRCKSSGQVLPVKAKHSCYRKK